LSCYITIDPATGEVTHDYVGDVTLDLTSASNGGAGYVAPSCDEQRPNPLVLNEQLPAYTIHTSLSNSPLAAPEFSWEGAPAMLAVAVMMLLMLKARRIKPLGS
jgi:hypothetical protein